MNILLPAVSSSIHGDSFKVGDLSYEEWSFLFDFSRIQGVSPLLYNLFERNSIIDQIHKEIKIKWAVHYEQMITKHKMMVANAQNLCAVWEKNGIRALVLKGRAIGSYYPFPFLRECGDFDCYLFGDFEQGNLVAEKSGMKVNRDYYKDSAIYYNGLLIENHKFISQVRGWHCRVEFEKRLRALAETNGSYEFMPNLLRGSAQFNALHLIYHAFTHFMTESIGIRHLCDWCCFIDSEQNNINWDEFYKDCVEFKLLEFAVAITDICVKYLGLKIVNPQIRIHSPLSTKILHSILYEDETIFICHYSKWRSRRELVMRMFANSWKYKQIAHTTPTACLVELLYGFMFNRNPKL